jgi:predicted polyphosphate/ATP-dependent NAD kinase
VNPIAGMGGRVGLHGTDGTLLADAIRRGASPVSGLRARRAVVALLGIAPDIQIVTVAGEMGNGHLPAGASCVRLFDVAAAHEGPTSADDTAAVVRAMAKLGIDILLFAGGDGTARDVHAAIGSAVPVVGIPAGVKMHSGVFARSPEAAGELAARFALDPDRYGCLNAEVVDRASSGAMQLVGLLNVPAGASSLQRSKSLAANNSFAADAAELAGLGREIAAEMTPGRLYLLGPGTTVGHISQAVGVQASTLGVDVVLNRELIAADASESELLDLLATHPVATLVIGVVGGQGFLLGRGNQQLSPAVLAAVGVQNIQIVAARSKVAALEPPVLRVDLGDPQAHSTVTGYHRVRTGTRRSTVLRVVA